MAEEQQHHSLVKHVRYVLPASGREGGEEGGDGKRVDSKVVIIVVQLTHVHSCASTSYTNRAAVDAETFDLGGLNEAQVSRGEARAGRR